MKKIIFLAMILAASFAQANELTVLESDVNVMSFRALSDARFQIDQDTQEGFVKVIVSEERPVIDYNGGGLPGPFPGGYNPFPQWNPTPMMVAVFEKTVKVDGLMLMADKVIYHAKEGSVECGTMGVSRIFKRPTIFLSGKCVLSTSLKQLSRRKFKVVVTLKTK